MELHPNLSGRHILNISSQTAYNREDVETKGWNSTVGWISRGEASVRDSLDIFFDMFLWLVFILVSMTLVSSSVEICGSYHEYDPRFQLCCQDKVWSFEFGQATGCCGREA